jgi:hypothetical protein
VQNNAYLLGTCNYWCDKAFSAYEVLSGVCWLSGIILPSRSILRHTKHCRPRCCCPHNLLRWSESRWLKFGAQGSIDEQAAGHVMTACSAGCTSPQSRYIFALSCMKLGKYIEAEKALSEDPKQVPNGGYGHFLLGRIARLTNRGDLAAAHFEKCLVLNPMLWSAYEELCSLGMLQSFS